MIHLKSSYEIEIMKEGGKILATLLDNFIINEIKENVTAFSINSLCEEYIISKNAIPILKGYKVNKLTYPYTICLSVNDEVIHGLPTKEKILKEGDLVSLDVSIKWNNYHLDAARTYTIGKVREEHSKLIEVTKKSLDLAIEKAKIGNRIGDLSNTIQNYVESNGYSVIRDFCGHGIGRNLHEDPQVLNFGLAGLGPKIEEGLVLAIEPMVNLGASEVFISKDKWTVKTKDGKVSCHFEDTVAISSKGPIILTRIGEVDG